MTQRHFTAFLMGLLLAACASQPIAATTTERPSCGDGVCGGPETAANCPQDCREQPADEPDPQPRPPEADMDPAETTTIYNPASGAGLHVELFLSGNPAAHTIILVPGGSGCGQDFLRPGAMSVNVLVDGGANVVIFDPDGRCQSEGEEDYDGFIHQDGLAAVIRYAAAHPAINAERMGILSVSFGITMASGTLARHPDLPIHFLIDYEGPATRDDTGGCDANNLGHLQEEAACDNETFWQEREALTFISAVRVPYERIQSEHDHVQPDNLHALAMINAAVDGASPWVRLNDLTPNARYDPDATIPYLREEDATRVFALALEYLPTVLAAP